MRILTTACLATVLVSPAFAGPVQVPAGKATVIDYMYTFNRTNCQFGPVPLAKVVGAPTHGQVALSKERHAIPAGKTCAGHEVTGVVVTYTPAPGWHGPDAVSVDYSWETYVSGTSTSGQAVKYAIEVK